MRRCPRLQKVVEAAPCLDLADDLRVRLTADALRLCARAGLRNAATVEFLVPLGVPRSPSATPYYFLEVNPRIQVRLPLQFFYFLFRCFSLCGESWLAAC